MNKLLLILLITLIAFIKKPIVNADMALNPTFGILKDEEPAIISDTDIENELYSHTGMKLGVRVGKLKYNGPTFDIEESSFSIHKPNYEANIYPYVDTLKELNKFSYSKNYFTRENFELYSNKSLDVQFYSLEGDYLGTISSEPIKNNHRIKVNITNASKYYVLFINNSDLKIQSIDYIVK